MERVRIRVKLGNNEIEVEAAEKEYVESKVKEFLRTIQRAPDAAQRIIEPAAPRGPEKRAAGKRLSMVEYVRSLAPKSGPQFVIAVGDYLERYGSMQEGFKTRDIIAGFQTVKYKHANPAEAVRAAKQQGFLMDGQKAGTMVVTHTGEAWVKTQLADQEDAT